MFGSRVYVSYTIRVTCTSAPEGVAKPKSRHTWHSTPVGRVSSALSYLTAVTPITCECGVGPPHCVSETSFATNLSHNFLLKTTDQERPTLSFSFLLLVSFSSPRVTHLG